jgi:hypothetical protein
MTSECPFIIQLLRLIKEADCHSYCLTLYYASYKPYAIDSMVLVLKVLIDTPVLSSTRKILKNT